ncbi:MAG: HAMP domain-containing histidine kinase [Anaerococcus sp.]|nr:HAMP domain-containing histidine kinase [Anaerococcus sp.]
MENNSLSKKLSTFLLVIISVPILLLVVTGIPIHPPANILGSIFGLILLISVPIVIVNIKFLNYIQDMILKPIKELLEGLEEVSQGNYQIRLENHQNDEIGDLIRKFNEMTKALNKLSLMNSKLEKEKQSIINAISHDLRTPLTVIQTYVDSLRDDIALTEEKEESYFNIIDSKISQLEERIEQLRNFSIYVNSKGEMKSNIFIKKSIDTIIKGLSESYQLNSLKLSYKNDVLDESLVTIDKRELEILIENLFINALKYNDKELPVINIDIEEDGDYIYIRFEDNGIGIREDNLDKIFEPLYKVDDSRPSKNEGMGLGLTIIREIVNKAQGSIEVESEVFKGTAFYIELPKAK